MDLAKAAPKIKPLLRGEALSASTGAFARIPDTCTRWTRKESVWLWKQDPLLGQGGGTLQVRCFSPEQQQLWENQPSSISHLTAESTRGTVKP